MKGSPWLEETPRQRPVDVLKDHDVADVAVVGGGISGLTTAYEVLEGSDRSVVLLEKGLVGHGATGHNGGQVVAAFERRFDDLADVFGEKRTAQGYRELVGAWGRLKNMLNAVDGEGLLEMAPAQLGIASVKDLQSWEGEMRRRRELGLPYGTIRAADDVRISPRQGDEVELVYRDVIEDLLWSRDHRYLAALEMSVGLMNSWTFTERLAEHLLAKYPQRFRIWERSPVERIRINDEEGVLSSNGRTVRADQVVLCTNGYRIPSIEACSVPAVSGQVSGVVGYMVGETSEQGVPGARAYFRGGEEPYFYLTRRRHMGAWLTAVGGPEGPMEGEFDPQVAPRPETFDRLERFMDETLIGPHGVRDHRWYGLMGYTGTGVRAVGRDPRLPSLFYNLGCNGIGLLSAVAGAKRLADTVTGLDIEPSMFDPEASLVAAERTVQRAR